MSNQKSSKTTKLALTDSDLHLIQNLTHLSLRNPEILSDFKTLGTGKFPVLCFFQDDLFQFLTVLHLIFSLSPQRMAHRA